MATMAFLHFRPMFISHGNVRCKRGSEFLRESGPRPPEALGILMQPPLMLASLGIINHFSMQPK